ncbi:MAG TPA: T9SS type A sorting domain-containing protein, partial [Saprospiraceae bacterium]|nr:T9SS type A sorting domain-containing protein [Saprospiraceae bacterium]
LFVGVNGGVWQRSLDEITTVQTLPEISDERISAFPSPVEDWLTLNIPKPFLSEDICLVLFDNAGRLTKSKVVEPASIVELDLHDIVSGIYFLHISSGSYSEIIRVVKQ